MLETESPEAPRGYTSREDCCPGRTTRSLDSQEVRARAEDKAAGDESCWCYEGGEHAGPGETSMMRIFLEWIKEYTRWPCQSRFLHMKALNEGGLQKFERRIVKDVLP